MSLTLNDPDAQLWGGEPIERGYLTDGMDEVDVAGDRYDAAAQLRAPYDATAQKARS